MDLTNKNIEEYIHRFMEGETTNAEEQAIYRFFRSGDVPEHLKVYAPMFAWYEEGMPEEKKEMPIVTKSKTFWKRIPLGVWSMGIAARLVRVTTISTQRIMAKSLVGKLYCFFFIVVIAFL